MAPQRDLLAADADHAGGAGAPLDGDRFAARRSDGPVARRATVVPAWGSAEWGGALEQLASVGPKNNSVAASMRIVTLAAAEDLGGEDLAGREESDDRISRAIERWTSVNCLAARQVLAAEILRGRQVTIASRPRRCLFFGPDTRELTQGPPHSADPQAGTTVARRATGPSLRPRSEPSPSSGAPAPPA